MINDISSSQVLISITLKSNVANIDHDNLASHTTDNSTANDKPEIPGCKIRKMISCTYLCLGRDEGISQERPSAINLANTEEIFCAAVDGIVGGLGRV